MLDIDRFVAECRAALREDSPPSAVKEVLARAVARPAEVEQALGVPEWGGLEALHRSPEITILNVVWTPGMTLYPHDHRMWAVIGLYGGREDNVFFRRTPQGLVQAGGRQLETTEVTVLGKTVIHAVTNPLLRFTGAIHIYGGDFFAVPRSEWTPESFEERPFDLENAKRTFAEANGRWRSQMAEPM